MAYKFQVGPAILSGSTTFEQAVSTADALSASAGVSGASVSADGNGSFGDLTVGTDKLIVNNIGVITLGGAVDTAVDVTADSFYFRDSDGSLKRETLVDYAVEIAGNGLAASSGSLAVVPDESSIEINADALRVKALGITNAMLGGSIANAKLANSTISGKELGTSLDALSTGNGLSMTAFDGSAAVSDLTVVLDGATLSVGGSGLKITDGGVDTTQLADASVDADKLATSVAGVGLSGGGGSALALDLNELTPEVLASGDFLAFVDSTDNGTHKETIDDLAVFMAGNGLGTVSGSLGVNTDGATIEVSSDAIQVIDGGINVGQLASDVAGAGLSGGGGSALAVGAETNGGIAVLTDGIKMDLGGLAGAVVNVSADSIAILDANDSSTKLESIAHLVSEMAGAGLTAASGELSVTGNNVALKADGEALVEGYNYFADASSNATVTLPATPSVGDVVVAKARALTSGAKIIINKGSTNHRIDGEESVEIESPFGAVTCVYVASDDWRIV